MKRMSLFILIAVAMLLSMNLYGQRVMGQELYDIGGSYPDNIIYPPEDGSVYFLAWNNERPEYVQDSREHSHINVLANMTGGRFVCRFNLDNFTAIGSPSNYSPGDLIIMDIFREVDGEIVGVARREWISNAGSDPVLFYDAGDGFYGPALALQIPPSVLFDSDQPAEYVITTDATIMAGYPMWEGDEYIYRANGWSLGKYWEIEFSTLGYENIVLDSSELMREFGPLYGPTEWKTYYQVGSSRTWVEWPEGNLYILPFAPEWVPISFDLPEAVENQGIVRIKWEFHAPGALFTGGYSQIRNVVVLGDEVYVPPVEYELTVAIEGEGTTVPEPGVYTYEEGTIVDLEAYPAEGWEFDRWVIDGLDVLDAMTSVTMNDDVMATAYFEMIILDPVAATDPVPVDGAVDVPIDTDLGWTYVSAYPPYADPVGFEIYVWDGDVLFHEGFIGGGPDTYTYNIPELAYETLYSWQIIPVTELPTRSTAQRTRAVQHNTRAAASRNTRDYPIWSFTTEEEPIVYYDLDISVAGNGTTDPAPGLYQEVYEAGDTVTITATAELNWQFDHWMINDIQVDENPYELLMNEDKVVVAHFSEIPPEEYTLSVDKLGEGMIYLNEAVDPLILPYEELIEEDTPIHLFAEAAEDWEFAHWMVNETRVVVTDNPYEFIMDGDYNIVAVFEELPPVPPFDIPYFNAFRSQDDVDLALAQGFELNDYELHATTDPYFRFITVGSYIESPDIDFTLYDALEFTFDTRNYGTGSNRELSLMVSTDGGDTYETAAALEVNTTSFETREVLVDLTDAYNVVTGKFKLEMTGGTGSIRFRDFYIDPAVPPVVEAPVFDPEEGTYYEPIDVTITAVPPEANIYFSFSEDPFDWLVYENPIPVVETTTIWAYAEYEGYESEIVSATYTIPLPAYTDLPYLETFDADLGDCYVYNVSGPARTWVWDSFDGNGYAYMNGYNTGDTEEDWLIIPGINLDEYDEVIMNFDTAYNFGSDDDDNYLKLFYSQEYAGVGDPTSVTDWVEIPFIQPATGGYTWTNSGELQLPDLTGTIWLGFKYHYTPGNYRAWQIDNINIEEAPEIPIVATPTFDPEAGTYYEPQNVEILTTTEDAIIYYSLSDEPYEWVLYEDLLFIEVTTTI